MRTKIVLMASILAFSYTYAQENPAMDSQMKNYSKKIDSIVVSEKSKMNTELDEVDKSFKDKKISNDEKKKQKQEIALKYEQIINEKVGAQQSDLEEATREIVKNAVQGNKRHFSELMLAENNALITLKSSKPKTKKELLKTNDLNFAFGLINLTKSATSLNISDNNSQIKLGRSSSTSVEFRMSRQLGKATSPVFYRFGLGYRGDYYSPERPKVFNFENSDVFLTDFTAGALKKSYMRNHYFTVPLDFIFVLNPKYTIENDEKILDNSKGKFRMTAGVYGGVKFLTQNYIIYKNEEDNRVKYIENIPGVANNFIFGGKISIGYGALNLFVKKDLTPVFNDHTKINNKYGVQIGLELLYINF